MSLASSTRLIREYVRIRLTEACKLPNEVYQQIDQAVAASGFWNEENTDESTDYISVPHAGDFNQTPAAETLQGALQDTIDELGFKIIFAVRSADAVSDPKMVIDPDHKAYPDGIVTGGQAILSPNGRQVIVLDMGLFTDEFNPADFSSGRAARKIGGIIRHEMVHFEQCNRRAQDSGTSRKKAYKAFQDDPKAIPDRNDPKYWENPDDRAGDKGFKKEVYNQDYFSSYIEVDAHAHQAADELLSLMGKDGAGTAMSQKTEWDDMGVDLPEPIDTYLLTNSDGQLANKFRTKVMKYIDQLVAQGVYESSLRSFIRQVLTESSDSLRVKKSPIHGVGVFVVEDIPAHTSLGPAQIRQSSGRYQVTDLGKYHNHSYKPTCYNKMVGDTRYLYPYRDLCPGDEVTIDYTLQADLEQPKMGWE